MIENSPADPPPQDPYQAPAPRPRWHKIAFLLGVRALVCAVVGTVVAFGLHHVGSSNRGSGYSAPPPADSLLPSLRPIPREPVEKKVGENVVYADSLIGGQVAFTVTKITVDGHCTEKYAGKAENGHYLFVDLTVETSPDSGPGYGTELFNPLNFTLTGPDGVTQTSSALATTQTYGCLSRGRALPAVLDPGQKYQGTVVLDARTTSGTLNLAPLNGRLTGSDRWKWRLAETA